MKRKFNIALSLALILTMLFTSVALADTVGADSDIATPGNQNSLTVAANPGATVTATVGLAVEWNGSKHLQPGDSLTLENSVSNLPSDYSVSSVSTTVPSGWSKDYGIFDAGDSTISFIAPTTPGPHTYNLKWDNSNNTACMDTTEDCVTSGTAFTINLTVNSAPTNTTPSVVVTGVTDGVSYVKGLVPAAICSVTDAQDGPSSFAATLSAITGPYSNNGIGLQTASCSHTHTGGLTATASATYSIVDDTPPVISYVLAPTSPDGDNGWYKSSVTLTWTVTEDESPSSVQKTDCVDQSITVDQFATDYFCSASSAGGPAGPVTVTIKRDATAPTFGDCPAGGPYILGSGLQLVGPIPASDATSLLDEAASKLSGTVDTSSIGVKDVIFTAFDYAGNSEPNTCSYSVIYNWDGFFQPVDNFPAWNKAKAGSAIPVKFSLGGDQGLNIFASGYPKVLTIPCTSGYTTADLIEETVTAGGSSLVYDAIEGQYVYVWKTAKTWATKCYQLEVKLIDGTSHYAKFTFK